MLRTLLRSLPLLALSALAPAAAAGTLYVDAGLTTGAGDGSSWADAFQGPHGLRLALSAAVAGDEVFVAQGTYLPTDTGSRVVAFALKSGVAVYGGFLGGESAPDQRPPLGSAPSVLSGDLAGNDGAGTITDNSYHVVTGAGSDPTALLDGFTISGGYANGTGFNNRGGGILCTGSSSPTVQRCWFVGNRSTFGGGAGYINGGAPSFSDCRFEDNLGGSFGGAFDIATAGAVRYDRCWFEGNSAARAGALEIFSTNGVVITNSVFLANTATGSSGGGGLWLGSGGNTRLVNCDVIANVATSSPAAGLQVQGASPVVAGSIFWDNVGQGGAQGSVNQISGTTNVSWSIVEGGFAGTGNLGLDPQLSDIGAGDLTLTAASPAIDAGSNPAVPAGVTLDFAGNPRFVDAPGVPDTGQGAAPVVDIGAYEYPVSPVGATFCSGDGSGTPCPCSNPGAAGSGCANGTFAGGSALSAVGNASVSSDTVQLLAAGSTPLQPGLFFQGDNALGGGIAFGDGLRCAGLNVVRLEVVNAGASGGAGSSVPIAATAGVSAGATKRYQWWYRDPVLSPCGAGFNLSNGLEIVWLP